MAFLSPIFARMAAVTAFAAAVASGVPVTAQQGNTIEFAGSVWRYGVTDYGRFTEDSPTGRIGLTAPGINITIYTRDGLPLDESGTHNADKVALELCRRTGRMFTAGTGGRLMDDGRLVFSGMCSL